MNIKNIFFLITLSLAFNARGYSAQTTNDDQVPKDVKKMNEAAMAEQFSQDRWTKILALVDGEIKTIKTNMYSGPELKHRLFELYSEKIKLIKEKETVNLLKVSAEDLKNKGKESFYKSSQAQFQTAQSFAISIVKQYPKYKNIDLIYYAMAINSRDYGSDKDTEKFLKLSIAHSKTDNETLYNAKTSLAEYYYNNKRYADAIKYYKDVLKNENNEWYTKHLYNAGWCQLKQRSFKPALELLIKSFDASANPKYISMKEQIFQAIGIFYVQADQTHDAIDFFLKHAPTPSHNLISLAHSTMSKNSFEITRDVLMAALLDSKKRKNANDEMKVRNAELNIYKESKKDDLFFSTSSEILKLYKKGPLNEDDVFEARNKIKEVAGFMQINLIKDKLADPVVYNAKDYNQIMRYFDILTVLDAPNKKLNRYYQGETALSTHQFEIAMQYYVRSILNAKIKKENDEITKKALDALLSTIELAKLSKKKNTQYSIFAMKNYVAFYPVDEKSQVIYQKLFNLYYGKGDLKRALNILFVYKKNYKADESIHREMLTQVLEGHIKHKQTDALAFWINQIQKGYLSFDSVYINKSIEILGSLLFDKYQTLEKAGKFKLAIEGYESIYDDKKYPQKTKAQAAYAIASLSLELNQAKNSYNWLEKSFKLFDQKEIDKLSGKIIQIARGLRLLQAFDLSTELSLTMIDKLCQNEEISSLDYFKVAAENTLLHKPSLSKLNNIESRTSTCNIPLEEKLIQKEQNLLALIYVDKYEEALSYFKQNMSNPKLISIMTLYLQEKFYNSPEKVMKDVAGLPSIDLSNKIQSYMNLKNYFTVIDDLKIELTNKPQFDEEIYNSELEQYFSVVTELNNQAVALSKKATSEEVILLRNKMNKPYEKLISAIENYIPQGVESDYVNGFKSSMRQITESLHAKSLQLEREKRAFLEKNNYFFQVQKNDIFAQGTESSVETLIKKHSAYLFSNTLDVSKSTLKRSLAGN